MKKIILLPLLILTLLFSTASIAQAITADQLLEILISAGLIKDENLARQLSGISNNSGNSSNSNNSSDCSLTLNRDIMIGSKGDDVVKLQQFLISKGFLFNPDNVPLGYFGPLTRAAVIKYQSSNGISPASGHVGPLTRAHVSSKYKCFDSGNSSDEDETKAENKLYFSTKFIEYNYTVGDTISSTYSNGSFIITNASSEDVDLKISIKNQPSWLNTSYNKNVMTLSAGSPMGVGAAVNPAGLAPGKYKTNIVITGDFSDSPKEISVTLNVIGTVAFPSCKLKTDKDSYVYGEDIKVSFSSDNARYTKWLQDNSGKDHLILPGDKLSARGYEYINASVVGNPTITLLAYNYSDTGSCAITIPISQRIKIDYLTGIQTGSTNRVTVGGTARVFGNYDLDGGYKIVLIGKAYGDTVNADESFEGVLSLVVPSDIPDDIEYFDLYVTNGDERSNNIRVYIER